MKNVDIDFELQAGSPKADAFAMAARTLSLSQFIPFDEAVDGSKNIDQSIK